MGVKIHLDQVRAELTPAQLAQAARLASRYNISSDAAELAVWSEGRKSAASASMNTWIRTAAGHGEPAAPEQDQVEAPRKLPTANAGNGARGPGPDVRNTNQRMNDFIRARRR